MEVWSKIPCVREHAWSWISDSVRQLRARSSFHQCTSQPPSVHRSKSRPRLRDPRTPGTASSMTLETRTGRVMRIMAPPEPWLMHSAGEARSFSNSKWCRCLNKTLMSGQMRNQHASKGNVLFADRFTYKWNQENGCRPRNVTAKSCEDAKKLSPLLLNGTLKSNALDSRPQASQQCWP